MLERARSGQLGFRDGLVTGSVATGVVALTAWAAVALPGGEPALEHTGAVGPVAVATPAPTVLPSTVQPAPTVSAPSGADRAASANDSSDDSGSGSGDEVDDSSGDGGEQEVPVVAGSQVPRATEVPDASPVRCPSATTTVSSAEELQEALDAARPGDVIELADGTYTGRFVAQVSGTADQPIWLCGGRQAVLQTGSTRKGYALHLAPAQHWRVVGLTIRNSQKGVVTDGTSGTVLQDLLVEDIGDEAIHLRSHSTGNAVLRNTIRRTGLRKEKFGEGVYIGSAEKNWPKYGDGGPDRSDFNLVALNTISRTSSESVDIKEGTTGGALLDNTFDGTGMTAADSWVDVKGNDWLIRGNTGRNTPKDGMQTHRILDGWGTGNVFTENVVEASGDGVGIYIHKPRDTANEVRCDNRDSSGGEATSGVDCSG
ncbi:hypothetical protein CLV92_11814 [Kineococcus xinjiangensis]|uniref:Parallel beta helix pectate lyase-like protein n=2 Tax=Kineococcus xinjiangensis TaxID=512762 RepID=A0A2S6ICM9_9ACTN|nr:hypothetical protein CLV92_11814 [Kineococcus xinjiangensis]